jgi:hypothetical protein
VHRYWNGLVDDFRIYSKALTDLEVQRLYDPTIEDPNVLIHYDFEGGDGTMAVDQSGNGNDGLFMGTPELVEGLFDTAVSIVLEDVDYIQTAAPLNITSNTVSVTGWVMHDEAPAAWSGILTTRGAGGNLGLQHDGSELRYMWGPDLYWSFSSGLQIPNGEWYFAALAISPDQAVLYLNGVGADQTAINVAPHDPVIFDDLIRVGRDHVDGRIMTSLIDEVRFFDRTITGEDVERLVALPPVLAENFDSLPVGSSMDGVPGWEGWFGDPVWAAKVVDTVAYSGTNSLEIVGTRDDVVPNWPMVDSGVYVATVMQYVPTGTGGSMYYGPLSSYGASWDDTAWLGTLLSNCDAGTVYVNELDAATRTEAPLVRDDWVELKIVMNFDADTCDFYYGDVLLGTLACPSAMGFDIWPDDNVDVLYYDDFKFESK